MKRLYLPFLLFLFLILEGVALELLPAGLIMSDLLIVPHWVLVILLFISVFYDREYTYYSVLYAFIFGLLIDIVYTGILGVYMFSYAFVIYIIQGLRKLLHGNILVTLLLAVIGITLADLSINMIYSTVGLVDMLWADYLMSRLVPTILANLLFLVFLYPVLMKPFASWGKEQLSGKKSF
ncbi:rod shape-determining protein MreD [Virgibacillus natechei]|uniref:Rod shape-determining protein MreD n=1 Tax=Virgibacillus natechei TaxID=1216297 RepID=A0ABS4IFI9_9BACI|nr:rod shape-determining protein MreD [Virgibacillus natechei]MBP1968799.1 rod shape-determining protein MreD [Virgibacillus natechei]UZD11597.1 rod shape-determining protein MreD [Virgibacillus natechei]